MKKTGITTTTYEHGDFLVDIVFDPETGRHGAWLYHKDFGVKNLMFETEESEADFLETVEVNLEEYEESYMEEYAE